MGIDTVFAHQCLRTTLPSGEKKVKPALAMLTSTDIKDHVFTLFEMGINGPDSKYIRKRQVTTT